MSLQMKETCICDQCGRERDKDTNHWWLLWREDEYYLDPSFVTCVWNEQVAKHGIGVQHLCGLTCLYKAIDKLAQEILKRETTANIWREEVVKQTEEERWQANS